MPPNKRLKLTGHRALQISVLPSGHEIQRFQLPGHRGRQLSREPLGGSAIDFLAMANLDDVDEKCRIVYGVDDPVATLADPVSVPFGGEFLTTARPWVITKRRDLSRNPLSLPLRYNSLKLLDRGRPDLDAISRHVASTASVRPRTYAGALPTAP